MAYPDDVVHSSYQLGAVHDRLKHGEFFFDLFLYLRGREGGREGEERKRGRKEYRPQSTQYCSSIIILTLLIPLHRMLICFLPFRLFPSLPGWQAGYMCTLPFVGLPSFSVIVRLANRSWDCFTALTLLRACLARSCLQPSLYTHPLHHYNNKP